MRLYLKIQKILMNMLSWYLLDDFSKMMITISMNIKMSLEKAVLSF